MARNRLLVHGHTIIMFVTIIIIIAIRETYGFKTIWIAILFYLLAEISLVVGVLLFSKEYREMVSSAWSAFMHQIDYVITKKRSSKNAKTK